MCGQHRRLVLVDGSSLGAQVGLCTHHLPLGAGGGQYYAKHRTCIDDDRMNMNEYITCRCMM